jgi:hypothetical protein
VWVRTNEFSGRFEARLADENELRHLFDRRKVVLERRADILKRARARFDAYLAKSHTDRSGNRTKTGPMLEFCVVPRFPSVPLCPAESLKQCIQTSWTNWRQVMFTDPGTAVVSQHESAIVPNAAKRVSICEANIWGLLFYGTLLDQNESGVPGIHSYEFVGFILLFIRHANSMLKALGYSGPLLLDTTLAAIRDVPWLHGMGHGMGRGLSARPGSEFDDQFAFSISTTTEEFAEKPDRIAMEVVRSVFFSVNRSEMVDSTEKLEELLRMGYEFNYWGRPTMLRV